MNSEEKKTTILGDYYNHEVHLLRREKFFQEYKDAALVLVSNPNQVMSNDVEFVYRQNSNLYYYTGFPEPESAAVLVNPLNDQPRYYLFVQPRDEEKETWTGYRYGPERAKTIFGADEVFLITDFSAKLPELIEPVNHIYHNFYTQQKYHETLYDLHESYRKAIFKEGRKVLFLQDYYVSGPHRLIKDREEIQLLRKACEISALGHIEAMKHAHEGVWEYELEGILDKVYKAHGGKRHAYPPIVAAGENATILHYIANQAQAKHNDLILIDAGVEFHMYNGDVTRTFPASGEFTQEQIDIYNIVLEAQEKAISIIKPGVKYEEIHKTAVDVLVTGMLELGLLSGEKDKIIEEEEYKAFYMHSTGHWLGLDTHDPLPYKTNNESVILQPGMVFTVEPGIYISSTKDAPKKYKGIGIRIEDDILVTENGYEILSQKAPKSIKEIEKLMER